MTTYKTYTGETIDLAGLTPRQLEFLDKARALIERGVSWADFQSFYLDRKSPIWFEGGDPKAERLVTTKVTRAPLYRVLQDMAGELGVAQGHLRSETGSAQSTITLEQFKEHGHGRK